MALFTAEEVAKLKEKFGTGELDIDSLMQLVHGKDIQTGEPFTRRLVVVGFFASDDDYRQEEFVGYLWACQPGLVLFIPSKYLPGYEFMTGFVKRCKESKSKRFEVTHRRAVVWFSPPHSECSKGCIYTEFSNPTNTSSRRSYYHYLLRPEDWETVCAFLNEALAEKETAQ